MSEQVQGNASQWFQARFTSLYESTPTVELSDLVSTFSQDAEIILNHEKISLVDFQAGISLASSAISRASVEWKEMMNVPPKEGQLQSQGGIVAGFFVVTRSMKIRIRAGPAQRLNYNTFSAKIDQDTTAPLDAAGGSYRITQLFITSIDKAAPIHLQGTAN